MAIEEFLVRKYRGKYFKDISPVDGVLAYYYVFNVIEDEEYGVPSADCFSFYPADDDDTSWMLKSHDMVLVSIMTSLQEITPIEFMKAYRQLLDAVWFEPSTE